MNIIGVGHPARACPLKRWVWRGMNFENAVPIFISTESSPRPNSALDHMLRTI
jgi:hypothetical protein